MEHLRPCVLPPAPNWFVVVTRRLKPNLPSEESVAHVGIKIVEIPEGTQVALVVDHRGEVSDVHRDVSTELNLVRIAVKQGSHFSLWPALILSEKNCGKPTRMLQPHAAVAQSAERSYEDIVFWRVVHVDIVLIVEHKLHIAKRVF